jgi:AcrR family transcriptional regulator
MPRQDRARATYETILDATARILDELGYRSLTTNGIAGVAGVAIGAVYAWFPNKETIVAELARRTVREVLSDVEKVFDGATGIDSKDEAIEMLVRTCMQVLRKNWSLWKVFNEDVPFFWELDEVKAFPMNLFSIAWKARAIAKPGILETNRRAMAYLYLLIPIGGWVPYAALVGRPSWLSERDAEDATVEIFKRLLA